MSTQSEPKSETPNNARAYAPEGDVAKRDAPPTTPSILDPFSFDGTELRVAELEGELWFVAADVCAALDLKDVGQALERLDSDERGGCTVPTPGGPQQMLTVSESGMYSLIFTSRKVEAKRFKKWVTSEVLPSIRKTGSYTAPAGFNALAHIDPTRVTYIGNRHDLTREGIYRAGCEVKLQGVKFVAKKYGVTLGFMDSIVRAGDRWLINLEKGLNKDEGIEKLIADALRSACNASPTLRDQT